MQSPGGSRSALERLPTELKQEIFEAALTDYKDDVHITLAPDGTTLEFGAFHILEKLKKVKETLHDEAQVCLFGPKFRFTFVSKQQPHRFVLRSFVQQVPIEYRTQIKHVVLPCFTLQGLVDPAGLEQDQKSMIGQIQTSREFSELSPYFKSLCPGDRIDSYNRSGSNFWTHNVITDLNTAITLLSTGLPLLTRLDLDLDIVDILPPQFTTQQWFIRNPLDSIKKRMIEYSTSGLTCRFYPFEKTTMLSILDGLKQHRNIREMRVRIFWGDFFQRGRTFNILLSDDMKAVLQREFIEALQARVPAKSITGHNTG